MRELTHTHADRGLGPGAGAASEVAERIADVTARLRLAPQEFEDIDPHTALLVPMIHREALGVLAA